MLRSIFATFATFATFYHILLYSIIFHYITNTLPMYSTVFYKILLIIKRMTTTTVAYSKSINM
jgi:hypothetical protein